MKPTEADLEKMAVSILEELGYSVLDGPSIAPGEPSAERGDYAEVILERRLRAKLSQLNPKLGAELIDDAVRRVVRLAHPSLVQSNRAFHRLLVDGVDVEYRRKDGTIAGDKVKLVDFDNPAANEFVAVNQFTVVENNHNRRADIVLFVNGMPLVVIELKNAADEKADIGAAFRQLQTYKNEIPSLFIYNEGLVTTDGLKARIGTLTSDMERFMPWRIVEGEDEETKLSLEMEVLLKGVCEKARFLDLIGHFIVFEESDDGLPIKKMAGYHQFHATRKAIIATVEASGPGGDRRVGVIWHTQGSGKSLTMAFYAGRIVLEKKMENPTIVVITDRNDLDGQLFGTFSRCHELLRQKPVQAESREHLKELLKVASGGVVFTTIQKFFPEDDARAYPMLSDRRNIVVIADEAHRSQYDFIDGFARYMREALPNASFIGFTGTPIELQDKSTRAIFGEYISIYDIQRAVEDGATVPIYYESRLARIRLKESEKPKIDAQFEEITEGQEIEQKERLKTKWAALEALVGADKRIKLIVADFIKHFEGRLMAMDGKAMVVCMSRRICVDFYNELIKRRPDWHSEDDMSGSVKIVMTGSASDPVEWQGHIRNKSRREDIANRFKNPKDPMKIVIVRDMWLTGFDVPCLHTMYLDKPMHGHTLMQAIARVNRVFRDKPGGLVVDYIGLADMLKNAMAIYTQSGGKGKTAVNQKEAVAAMLEKYEICCDMFHGFDFSQWARMAPAARISMLPSAIEHILSQENGGDRFVTAVKQLSDAFALAVPDEQALRIKDDVGFFQTVKAGLNKMDVKKQVSEDLTDFAIRQIVSGAIASDKILKLTDIVPLPDISILSDEFLTEVNKIPQRNLAAELLKRLISDEIRDMTRKNVVQGRSFAQMLEEAITKYHGRAEATIQFINELIKIAKEMKEANARGEKLGFSEAELAFYDALETNDSAVKVLGDKVLRTIAVEIAGSIAKNASIDWDKRESVKAAMRVAVKRILRKYNYPPDKQEKAVRTVMEQAELTCKNVVEALA
jgi:type I restriction enzyme R subunit